jgi:anti-anti-sigma factor
MALPQDEPQDPSRDPDQPQDLDGAGSVTLSGDDRTTVVTLSGEIDLALSPELDQAAAEVIARGLPSRIEAGGLTFIDSVGIGFIARVVVAGRAGGWRPVLGGAHRRIIESLTLAGLAGEVDLVED